jgi:predicted RNase H-like nuclease (RuvC/YqgF family)
MIPLSEAAERTGKTKQAIRKAIANGRIRGDRNQSGHWVVDPASLFAVYSPVDQKEANHTNRVDPVSEAEIEGLRKQIAMLENERDDLRRRLDMESEERRKLTALLTDNRSQEHPGFWSRLFGK